MIPKIMNWQFWIATADMINLTLAARCWSFCGICSWKTSKDFRQLYLQTGPWCCGFAVSHLTCTWMQSEKPIPRGLSGEQIKLSEFSGFEFQCFWHWGTNCTVLYCIALFQGLPLIVLGCVVPDIIATFYW